MLKNFGFQMEIASEGREAVEKVTANSYDLILMDLQMPVMGGVEAAKIIRKELGRTMPILALTAGVAEDDKGKCLAAGMNDYLMKPIEIHKLKEKIIHWIKEIPPVGGVGGREEERTLEWDEQKAIKELGVPEALYRELLLGFIDQFAATMLNLEKAFQGRDFEGVAKAAHFIKGAAGNLRIEEIHVAAKELEAVAKGSQDASAVEGLVGRLKNALGKIKKII
jgi:CheY-like chemotaxis protein